MTTANVRYLRTHGPSTTDDLPVGDISVSSRADGVQRFNPSIGMAKGSSVSSVGKTRTVYYLADEHEPGAVIREWAVANPRVLDASPRAFLDAVNSYGGEFKEVSTEVARDLYGESRWLDVFGQEDREQASYRNNSLLKKLKEMDPDDL